MIPQNLKIDRDVLAQFLPSHDAIKKFEKLFQVVDQVQNTDLDGDPYIDIPEGSSSTQIVAAIAEYLATNTIEQPRYTPDLDVSGLWGDSQRPAPGQSDNGLWEPSKQGAWVDQNNPVLSKTSGRGIKVDIVSPTFPWADIIGLMEEDPGGANSPVLTTFRGGLVRDYAYTTNDKVDLRFHIPHDYAPGTDMHVHVHWSHNGTAISGNFTLSCASTYAKGHNQAIYPAEKTVTITYATVDIATTPQYIHRIDEVPWSSNGGSATLFDSALIEPDGLVKMNCTLTSLPTITGGSTPRVFIDFIDLHYQSTGINTKQKAPNFYV